MNTLKIGSDNIDVLFLQKRLGLKPTGKFDAATEKVVKDYQTKNKLVPDGIVGKKTWATFTIPQLTENDYKEAAKLIGCDVAAVKAIKTVESGGKGFVDGIRPTILFEGHVFYSELKKRGKNPELYTGKYPNVVYKSWNKSKYKGGNAEYDRIGTAMTIDQIAALGSASMGLFQIMGNNYKSCGYSSVIDMWADACMGEKEQLLQVCHFLKSTGIDKYLKAHDWANVARKYNGAGYKANNYDVKLKQAYDKFNK